LLTEPPIVIQPMEPTKDDTFVQIQDGITFVPYRHCCGCSRSPNIVGFFFNLLIWLAFLFMLLNLLFRLGLIPLDQIPIFYNLAQVYKIMELQFWALIYAGVFLVYLIEVFCTNSCKYLHHMDFVEDFVTYVNRIKNVRPLIGFWCECYHYETRYRTVEYTDSNGNRQTRQESYQEKVVTHSETEYFSYNNFDDISGNVTLDILVFIATKVKFSKNWSCGDERTRRIYEIQEVNFIERNKYRDTHFSSSNIFKIDGFEERKLCLVEMSRRSAIMTYGFYLLFSLLLLASWPYRIWLEYKTVRARFHFHKRIYA